MDIPNFRKLGRYDIVSKIGEGGMGIVYKALDPVLERNVALKVGKVTTGKTRQENDEDIRRCIREARLAAQFIHPNIAILYDAGVGNGVFYMAIEYVEGEGLDAHTNEGGLLPRITVLETIFTICHALEYIHEKGYIHLDIKPSNIMRTHMGEMKLMDFGIARVLKGGADAGTGDAGSFHYMSPEQADGKKALTRQSDIYSLGVVMYELLTGNRPFTGDNILQLLYRMTHEGPKPIDRWIPDISPELVQIVERSLSVDPEHRYKSAKEFADALLPVIKGKDTITLDREEKKKTASLKKLLFFKHFEYAELGEVIKISTWSVHKENTCIIDADDNDSSIYFIVRGRASIHMGGVKKAFLAGDCLGDSAILYDMPKQASVMTDTTSVVMKINAKLLNQAEDSLQLKFVREFYKVKLRQLVESNLKLIQAEGRANRSDAGQDEGAFRTESGTGLLLPDISD